MKLHIKLHGQQCSMVSKEGCKSRTLSYEEKISCVINCTGNPNSTETLSIAARQAIGNSLSKNSIRAYASDISMFEKWGCTIPAKAEQIATYLAELMQTHAASTLNRKIASLSKAHRALGGDDPCKAEIVRSTMRGIRRSIGTAQHEAKPLMKEDLFAVLEQMGNRPKDIRDKAILLIGFAGAFRRSELVELNVEDIEFVKQGIIIQLRRSKTDQTGQGRKIGIPHGRTKWCPVKLLVEWMQLAAIEEGQIFRLVNRHGQIKGQRLSGEAVSLIIKERVQRAGFEPIGYSGHSLRAGLATSAAMAGASTWKIRQQTGHASDAMLNRYIRDGNLFNDNAAGSVL